MEVSGQLHAPAVLPPGKEPPVPIESEARWAPEPSGALNFFIIPRNIKYSWNLENKLVKTWPEMNPDMQLYQEDNVQLFQNRLELEIIYNGLFA
jgi:hypothetical protein